MANNHPNRTLSLLRNNTAISQSLAMTTKGATLASIYQAKKSGKEETKVEVLKQQFQSQIENRMITEQSTVTSKLLNSSHIPSRHEREVNEFRKLEREKSFDEARTAVQSQIEKIFMKTGGSSSNNAKGMPMLPSHTTTNRVSRRDLEARHSTINNNNHSRRRMPSLEKKGGVLMSPLGANNSRSSSMTVVGARNAIPEVINHAGVGGGAKRHNMTSRHHSVDTLAVAPGPRSSASSNNVAGTSSASGSKQVSRYQGTRRARELEQHLRDKYGLPEEGHSNKKSTSLLRRTNSHSSLTQFSTESIMRQHHSNGLTLTRRKSSAVFEPPPHPGNQDHYGPKSYTHLRQHQLAINEPRDSKLRYLGRMSPEEQVDKYLKSVEKVNEARLRQMQHQQRSHHRVPDYHYYHHHPSQNKINTSMMSSRWHSLDSVSRPVIVKNIREMKSGVSGKNPGGGPNRGPAKMQQQPYREKNDLKSYTSMPQISHGGRNNRPRTSPNPGINNLRKNSESLSEGKSSKIEADPMSTSSDGHMKSSRESTPDDDHDSCSCTDVTLDETLRINHNHRKSMARKKKLQAQRLMELQKAEELSLEASSGMDLDNSHLKERGISANYLGSITLDSKSSDLLSLQKPLKSLYFKYVIAQQAGLSPTYGNLAITNTGLKVQYKRNEKLQELFSSFTSIAVWAAVRFVHKTVTTVNKNLINHGSDNNSGHYYAFLPLITDPGDEARNRLFCPLAKSELKYTKRSTLDPQHPPMFACITRTGSFDKELECHGFICKSTEEAVSVAAQLYQALLETMKTQGNHKKYRLSRASSISMGSVTSFDKPADSEEPLKAKELPQRPLRRKTTTSSSSGGGGGKMSTSSTSDPTSSGASSSRSRKLSMKRTQSSNILMGSSEKAKIVGGNGDIYTKVAMPRSKSFMKMNTGTGTGNHSSSSQYNLQDLFKELKDQHGIASIDDLLRHVIKPEGMSFNGIEPVYRELLLKLAMSMSKDEIFIRSKTIMDEEKDKKKALLLMGGSKLLNNKNSFAKDSATGRFIIPKQLDQSAESIGTDAQLNSAGKDKSLGGKIFNKKPFLMKRKNSQKNSKKAVNKNEIKVLVGGKTASGSISKRFNNSSRRSGKRSNLNKLVHASPSPPSPSPKSGLKTGAEKDKQQLLTKFDIGSPMPLADGVRDEVAKKWMITDIKDISSSKADILEDMKSGPDSGITSGGQTMKSSTTKAEDMMEMKSQGSCSECSTYGEKLLQSTCSCSMFGTATPSVKSRIPPSSTCSTCYCQTCGEDSATATCYSCSSVYSDGSSTSTVLERKSSIKSISRIGERTLAIIDTDSDSSLGSFGSIDSPKTAWRKNVASKAAPDQASITDSSVASVIEAVNKATEEHEDHGSRGEVGIDGYFRNPTASGSAVGTIYGFTLRRKVPDKDNNVNHLRPSFRQYHHAGGNGTITSRQSRISVDSLASPLSSLTLIGQNKSMSGHTHNIDSAMATLNRNRGPRPAYSDANMQHSLGYLP